MTRRHFGVPMTKFRRTYTGGRAAGPVIGGIQGSTPRSRRAYSGVDRGPAWNARAFVAIILAIVAVALVIWFALGG